MTSEVQVSELSRGPLFERQVLGQYLIDLRSYGIPQEAERARSLAEWLTELESSQGTKETSLEQRFNQKVLGDVLGYRLYPSPEASAWPKTSTSVTGIPGEPDVTLGRFVEGEPPTILAVLELKGPKANLDKPAMSGKTPVQQAFEYGEQILGVRWVLVSNLKVIRLYSVESPTETVVFNLADCVAGDSPTAKFRELWALLSYERLVADGDSSSVSRLLAKSVSRQLEIRDSFYETYYQIRADLLGAVSKASQTLDPPPGRDEILTATQRLLDRMLFIYYCEDTPGSLLPPDTVKDTTGRARALPGPSPCKVYTALKNLFREVDQGSPPANVLKLVGYNGELFKFDRVVDVIELPDSLHDEAYEAQLGEVARKVEGVWGLHAFDFWRELNEHLLGHIFEQSLSDIVEMLEGQALTPARLAERRRHGIYYTSELLSNFLCQGSVEAVLRETAPITSASTQAGLAELLERRRQTLADLRILDLAAGSGAFLVSSYQAMLQELWQIRDALDALEGGDLLTLNATLDQSKLLRDSLHAVDLLPQAIEIAKLALWLRSVRKGEKIPDLSGNLVTGNSLNVPAVLGLLETHLATFDMVVGNPPWGGEVEPEILAIVCEALGLTPTADWDSFELFVALGLAFYGKAAVWLTSYRTRSSRRKRRRLAG